MLPMHLCICHYRCCFPYPVHSHSHKDLTLPIPTQSRHKPTQSSPTSLRTWERQGWPVLVRSLAPFASVSSFPAATKSRCPIALKDSDIVKSLRERSEHLDGTQRENSNGHCAAPVTRKARHTVTIACWSMLSSPSMFLTEHHA